MDRFAALVNSERIVVISTQVPRARAGGGGGQGQLRAGRAAPQLPRGHREAGEGWRHVYMQSRVMCTCHLVTDRHHRHAPGHPGLRGQRHRVPRIQICLSVSILQVKCSNGFLCNIQNMQNSIFLAYARSCSHQDICSITKQLHIMDFNVEI